MERAKVSGEVIRAKANAVMLSAIPNPPEGKHFYLTDLHAAGITEYFEGGSHVEHVYAMPAIVQTIRSILGTKSPDIIVGSADTGRVDWVESYARSLDTGLAVITKRRQDGENVELLAVGGNSVKGKIVIIYDDMIRSGGTIIKAIEAYKNAGATRVIVATSHLVLVEGGLLHQEKAVDRSAILCRMFVAGASDIITTNSLPQAQNLSEWLTFPSAVFRSFRPATPEQIVVVESSTLEKKTLHVVDLSAVYTSALRDGTRTS
jgi:ribose-phosphate pyrophosphokinase